VSVRSIVIIACVLLSWSAATASAYKVDRKNNRIDLVSVEDFNRCQDELSYSDGCLDALKRFVKTHPKDSFAAGKLVRARFAHWVALQFFVPALSKKSAPQLCGDEDLRMAVISGLSLPEDEPGAPLAIKAAGGVCAATLQPHLKGAFVDANPFYKRNACSVLAKQPDAPMECAPPSAEPAK
jgi:hypothetical protein